MCSHRLWWKGETRRIEFVHNAAHTHQNVSHAMRRYQNHFLRDILISNAPHKFSSKLNRVADDFFGCCWAAATIPHDRSRQTGAAEMGPQRCHNIIGYYLCALLICQSRDQPTETIHIFFFRISAFCFPFRHRRRVQCGVSALQWTLKRNGLSWSAQVERSKSKCILLCSRN